MAGLPISPIRFDAAGAERERGQLKWKKTAVVSNAGEYSAAYVCCVDGDMTLCVSMAITS